MSKKIAPYGCWPSAISSELLTQGVTRLQEPQLAGDHCYWLESRPQDQGRTVLVCQDGSGKQRDITLATMTVRTRIHEYGGGSYRVTTGAIYFVNDSDQRIYCLSEASGTPYPISPQGNYRYSDFCIDHHRQQLLTLLDLP